MSRTLLTSAILAGLLAPAWASAIAEANTELDAVVVRGDLIDPSVREALADRHEAPNARVVIDGEQLNQFNDLSVGDAIRRLPGVTFPGVNRSRDARLRAIGGEYTQVLLDGRPFLDGNSSRNMEVDRLPAAMIERIEIVRSPLAGQPAAGIAGTINIITKRHYAEPSGGVSLGAGHVEGNGDTGDAALWYGGEHGILRAFAAVDAQRRLLEEGSRSFAYTPAGAFNGGSDQDQKRTFEEHTLTTRLDFALGARDRLVVTPSLYKTRERRDQSDRVLTAAGTVNQTTNELRRRVRETYGSRVEWQHDLAAGGNATLYYETSDAREDTTRDSQRFNAAGVQNRTEQRFSDVDLDQWNAGAAFAWTRGAHAFDAGVGFSDATRDEDESRLRNGAPQTPDYGRIYAVGETVAHAWIADGITLSPSTLLTAGARVERSRTRTTSHESERGTVTSTDVTPTLQLRHALNDAVDLRAGLARTLRRPDLRDLTPTISEESGTLSSPDTAGNPDTRPERAWGLDLGIDGYLDDRRGLVSANLFSRRIEDKIEDYARLVDGRWLAKPENVGTGKLYGAEVEGRLPLTFAGLPDLVLWANATRVHTSLRVDGGNDTRRFDQQPDLVANLGLDWFAAPLRTTFGVNANRVFAYDQAFADVDGVVTRTAFAAQTRLDLSARTQLGERTSVSLSALNLLATKDRRSITNVAANGTPGARTEYREPSNATFYARVKYVW
ncbi:TonB-dependent receptor plug domain-containing protein [Dokdonella sp. MW10]|uniref:TonB-dependent receptor plug domain-containing protein n=1 Tax=Dokdonella sp. MW10 TaxID=2992926 RepID=UPI003F7D3A72